jgi:hypothetical protein
MDFTDDRGMFMFSNGQKEAGQYSFQEVQELASVYKTFQNSQEITNSLVNSSFFIFIL